jgi:hypothetical protein
MIETTEFPSGPHQGPACVTHTTREAVSREVVTPDDPLRCRRKKPARKAVASNS